MTDSEPVAFPVSPEENNGGESHTTSNAKEYTPPVRVRLMQQIDYFAGIPLCALLSVWDGLVRTVHPRKHTAPQKILFIELSEMGSAILAYASLKAATEKVGRENVYFLIFEKNRESVDILDIIPRENVLTISDKNMLAFIPSALKAIFSMRSRKIDTCLDLELFSRCTSLLSYLSGAKNRVGFDNFTDEGLYRGSFITHRVLLNNHQHISLNFMALLRALDQNPKDLPLLKENVSSFMSPLPKITPSDEERTKIMQTLRSLNDSIERGKKLVVLNPDPGLLPLRGWPIERYRELSRRLLETDPSVILIATGLPRSKEYAEKMFRGLDESRCVDMCGHTANLREVVTLLSLSKLLVTNDSGPAHLASLAGIPTVVLFGPESPEKYGPLGDRVTTLFANLSCSPCYSPANHRRTICTNNVCLKSISVEDVFRVSAARLG